MFRVYGKRGEERKKERKREKEKDCITVPVGV
jgi:hypothetical protein